MPRLSLRALSIRFSYQNLVSMSLCCHACYMPCSSHHPRANHPNTTSEKYK
jgi:hypothetical protein